MTRPTVAIIGASANRKKFGNISVRAHADQGYDVYPVNPRGGEVEGLLVSESISDVPVAPLDRVSMYVGPQVGITMLDAIAEKGCGELYLNPGTASPELVQRAEELGLNPIESCSIVDLGLSPSQFPSE